MSYHAQVWARGLELPPAPKSVLLALAFRADINQACLPSQGRIARDTGLSERTVRRHLRWLEAQGLITRKKRFSDDGQQLSDRYVLLYGPDTETAREDSPSAPGQSRRPQGADAGAAKYTGTDKKNLSGESKKRLERDRHLAEEAADAYWQNNAPAPDRDKWLELLKSAKPGLRRDEDE